MNRRIKIALMTAICFIIAVVSIIIAKREQGNTLNVCVVLPLTGPSAEFGNAVKRAMDKWVELNEKERCFSLSFIDAESSPAKAVSAFHENAISRKPDLVIVGPTYLANAVIPAAAEMNVFVLPIATFFSALKDMNHYTNFQAVSLNIDDSVDPILRRLTEDNLNCAIVYSNDDFGLLSKNYIEAHYAKSKIEASYPFSPKDNTVRDTVARCIESKVSSVIITGTTYPAYISAAREFFQQGFKGMVFADIAFSNPFVVNAMGAYVDGVSFVCTSSDFMEDDGNLSSQTYYEACRQLDQPPYFLTLQAWDSLQLANHMFSEHIDWSRDAIKSTGFDGVLHNLTFSTNGAANYSCVLARFQDGKLVKAR